MLAVKNEIRLGLGRCASSRGVKFGPLGKRGALGKMMTDCPESAEKCGDADGLFGARQALADGA